MHHAPLTYEQLRELRTADASTIRSFYESLLTRIRQADPAIQALLPEPDRQSRVQDELETLLERYPEPAERPPLFAIPAGVKDLFRVTGFETRAGSRLPTELFEGEEAPSVTSIRANGAIVIGKTVTTEFAYFEPGPTRNPWNQEHTPGGSSSGSAAAVSAGYCGLALGTQTIGSVNRPASYCGIVGFKPGIGRISLEGIVPFSASADQVGVLAPDARTAALAASVLCESWNARAKAPPAPRHLLLLDDSYAAQAEQGIRGAISDLAERLQDDWAIERGEMLSSIESLNTVHTRMIAREFADVHERWFAAHASRYSEKSRDLILAGRNVTDDELAAARAGRDELRTRIEGAMQEAGVLALLTPSATGAAPVWNDGTGSPLMSLPWTYCGLPTVTLPLARSRDGLPLGLQLVGRRGHDEYLMQLARDLELQIGFSWH